MPKNWIHVCVYIAFICCLPSAAVPYNTEKRHVVVDPLNKDLNSKSSKNWRNNDIKHGGVKMGVITPECDDGKWNIELDWDDSRDYEYRCQENEHHPIPTFKHIFAMEECLPKSEIQQPIHTCMNKVINYKDKPPRGGAHRPLWPVYGEYLYCPPQRWVHTLEHGSVVFLYHPCADSAQIKALRQAARSCIRRHIITPYRDLPLKRPFALVTWGCKLLMNHIDSNTVHNFIKKHALQTAERKVSRDGQYQHKLLRNAQVVSDIDDSRLCPNDKMFAEKMKDPYEFQNE